MDTITNLLGWNSKNSSNNTNENNVSSSSSKKKSSTVIQKNKKKQILSPSKQLETRDFIGIDEQKEKIKSFFENLRETPWGAPRFLMISGPRGTNKNELTKSIAEESEYKFREFLRGNEIDGVIGGLETRIQNYFKEAKESNKFTCLFIDDLDSICPKFAESPPKSDRHNQQAIVSLFAAEIRKLDNIKKVVLIGSVADLANVNTSILEVASTTVSFSLPNEKLRREMINLWLKEITIEGAILERLAQITIGWSTRNIKEFTNKLIKKAEEKILTKGSGKTTKKKNKRTKSLSIQDITEVFNEKGNIFENDYPGLKIYPPELISNATPENPFPKLVGLEKDTETQLEVLCDYLNNPKKYKMASKNLRVDTLLYGPPGTGKTEFARGVKDNSTALMVYVEPSIFQHSNRAAIMLKKAFSVAKGFEKSVIFIDEIDKCLEEGSDSREVFQTEVEGFVKSENSMVVIGATNYLKKIAEPSLSRFSSKILVDLPDEKQRQALFVHCLKNSNIIFSDELKREFERECETLAKASEGFSHRMITTDVVSNAVVSAVFQANKNQKNNKGNNKIQDKRKSKESEVILTLNHLLDALSKVKNSIENRNKFTINLLPANLKKDKNITNILQSNFGKEEIQDYSSSNSDQDDNNQENIDSFRGKIFVRWHNLTEKGVIITEFVRHSVSSDGDCGYTAFGITRDHAVRLLTQNIIEVEKILKPVIEEELLQKTFINYLVNNGLASKNLVNAFKRYENTTSHTNNQAIETLKNFSSDLTVVQGYINYDLRDKKIDAGWAHPRVLQALAKIQNVNLFIWKLKEERKIIPHPIKEYATYKSDSVQERKDLLFIDENHFELLEIQGVPQDEISSSKSHSTKNFSEQKPTPINLQQKNRNVSIIKEVLNTEKNSFLKSKNTQQLVNSNHTYNRSEKLTQGQLLSEHGIHAVKNSKKRNSNIATTTSPMQTRTKKQKL